MADTLAADFPKAQLSKDFPKAFAPKPAEKSVQKGGLPPFAGSALDPMVVAGKGLEYLRRPLKKAFDVAGQADVRAGIKPPATAASRANTYANIPISMAAGALTGGAGLVPASLAQMATTKAMQEGGLEATHPLGPIDVNVALSGASPFIAAGIGRGVRGLGRAATRMIPSRFTEAQQAAQTELGELAEGLKPKVESGSLFTQARSFADAQRVPAGGLRTMLNDLDTTIPAEPTSGALKTAREFVNAARKQIAENGDISLGDLMRLRLDLGRSSGAGPEVAALYKAVLGDLERAGVAQGAGARLAVQALDSARKERGAALLQEITDKATKGRSALTGELPLLSMSQLGKEVQNNKAELVKMLGQDGFAQIEQFLVRNRALPPTHAYTVWNGIASGVVGGLGIGGGAATGGAGVAGLLGWELLKDAYAVGRNPVELQKFLVTLGAGLPGVARQAVGAK